MSGSSIARGELPETSALSLAEFDIFIKEGEAGSLDHIAVRDQMLTRQHDHLKGAMKE